MRLAKLFVTRVENSFSMKLPVLGRFK